MSRLPIHLAALAFAAGMGAHAEPIVSAIPTLPGYGQPVELQMAGSDWPPYLPATRYTVQGNLITLEYEYVPDNFAASRSDYGYRPISVGELPPGNYRVQARLIDYSKPDATPLVVDSQFPVVPPESWGLYTVPMQPGPLESSWAVIRSAAYFDPASMRVSVQAGNVIRVDFDYAPDAPVGAATPPAGLSSFGAVRIGGLAAGRWTIEGWGRARTTGAVEKYFTREVVVGGPVSVVEYYAPSTNHYFITANPADIKLLDGNPQLGWKRTGERFRGWASASDAPPGAQPVCRFYSRGVNSHFYTGDQNECRALKDLESKQRADALAKGLSFEGWQFEAIAFYALVPSGGTCPSGTDPVYRLYNDRAAENDTNHRFTADAMLRAAMAWTWVDEGAVFCSPR